MECAKSRQVFGLFIHIVKPSLPVCWRGCIGATPSGRLTNEPGANEVTFDVEALLVRRRTNCHAEDRALRNTPANEELY